MKTQYTLNKEGTKLVISPKTGPHKSFLQPPVLQLYELIFSFIIIIYIYIKRYPVFAHSIHGYNQLVGMRLGLKGQTRAQRQGDFKDVGAEL